MATNVILRLVARYGVKTMEILKAVAEGAADFITVATVIMTSPYGSSFNQMQSRIQTIDGIFLNPSFKKERRSLQQIIYKLRKDGLLEVSDGKINPTGKGKLKIKKTWNPLPDNKYGKNEESGIKIIAFDVPEKERRKRMWLRRALKELGFEMLQESVWYGNKKVPERFIRDIQEIGILDCVSILEVNKTGSAVMKIK